MQLSKVQVKVFGDSGNALGCRSAEDVEYYQLLCLVLAALCIFLVLALTCVYCLMRRKINKLVQIHDFGMPEGPLKHFMMEPEGARSGRTSEITPARMSYGESMKDLGSATSRPLDPQQQGRDAIIRIIKYQLDQYLVHSNANYAIQDLNYNFANDKPYFDEKDPFKFNEEKQGANPATPSLDYELVDMDEVERTAGTSPARTTTTSRLSGQETSVLQ